MEAQEMYTRTIENLRRSIEQHETPSGKTSVKAFAEAYGFSRQNLVEVLGGNAELSVGLFMRLEAALRGQVVEVPAKIERWSLCTWLEVDTFAVQKAMYSVNFAG